MQGNEGIQGWKREIAGYVADYRGPKMWGDCRNDMCKEPLNSKYCGTDDKEEGREGKIYHLGREEGVIQDG